MKPALVGVSEIEQAFLGERVRLRRKLADVLSAPSDKIFVHWLFPRSERMPSLPEGVSNIS